MRRKRRLKSWVVTTLQGLGLFTLLLGGMVIAEGLCILAGAGL